MLKLLVPLLALFCLALPAPAQYRWVPRPDGDQVDLAFGPNWLGAWFHKDGRYYPWTGNGWLQPVAPPIEPPTRNFGVVRSKLDQSEHVTYQGREITPEHARRLLGAPDSIPQDQDRPWWVVVGTDADCVKARAILDRAPFSGVARIQCYRPDDAMIRDRQGKVMYAAGITLVDAQGTVIGHSEAYDSADELLGGLRLLDPSASPEKFPRLKDRLQNAAAGALTPNLALGGGSALLLFGLAAAALLRRRSS